MDIYKKMYLSLANDVCDTIDNLRLALKKCEEIYVSQYEEDIDYEIIESEIEK